MPGSPLSRAACFLLPGTEPVHRLHERIQNGDVDDLVTFLGSTGTPLKELIIQRDHLGQTCFHSRLTDRAIPKLEALVYEMLTAIADGELTHADVMTAFDAKDDAGYTPLLLAAERGEFGVMRFFLGNGVDVSARNNDGNGIFHAWARQGRHLEEVDEVARAFADIVHAFQGPPREFGGGAAASPTEKAATSPPDAWDADIAALVDVANRYGETPLMLACARLRVPAVQVLVRAGASLDGVSTRSKMSAFECVLRNPVAGLTPCRRRARILQLLASRGEFDVNAPLAHHSAQHDLACSGSSFGGIPPLGELLMARNVDPLSFDALLRAGANVAVALESLQDSVRESVAADVFHVARVLYRSATSFITDHEQSAPPDVHAAAKGLVQQLVQHGDVERRVMTERERLPVTLALIDDPDVARQVVEAASRKGDLSAVGRSCLEEAFRHRNLNVVRLLVDSGGVSVESLSPDDAILFLPLFTSTETADGEHGVIRIIRWLINECGQRDRLHAVGAGGNTWLHMAAKTGMGDLVRLLIASGANVNARNRDDHTPLSSSLEVAFSPSVTSALLEAGATLVGLTQYDLDLTFQRVLDSSPSPSDLLTQYISRMRAEDFFTPDLAARWLWYAFARKDLEAVKALVAGGGEVDAVDENGDVTFTPLFTLRWPELDEEPWETTDRRQDDPATILRWVLEDCGKIDRIDTPNNEGNTWLHLAVGGHPEVVRTLLDAGADVNTRNAAGQTPLDRCPRTRSDVRELLISRGAIEESDGEAADERIQ